MRTQAKRAFTLIEILIVVVILGILAAIVIPQFTDASQQASDSSVKSQLQTVRSQIELFRVKNNGNNPTSLDSGDWSDLVTPTDANGDPLPPYLHSAPRNPLNNSETVDSAAAAGVGWVWRQNAAGVMDLFAVAADGTELAY